MPKFFTAYDTPPKNAVSFLLPSKTEQAHKDTYDLNRLVSQYSRTGVLATADQIRDVFYGDFSDVVDTFDSHIRIKQAETAFMDFPAEVRAHFDNDPVKMLRSLRDDSEGNIRKLVELGLVRESRLQAFEPAAKDVASEGVGTVATT